MDFRQYDNALGRFNGIDLLAENSMEMTPYHFGNNNPNYWADPSGLDPTDPPGDWQPEAVVINRTTKKKHKVLSSASVIDGFLSGVFSGSNYGANPFVPGSFESISGGGGGGIASAGVISVSQPITASMPVFRPAATTTGWESVESEDGNDNSHFLDYLPNFTCNIGIDILTFKGLHYGIPEFETSFLKNSAVTPGPFVLYPPKGSTNPDLNTHEPGHVLQFLVLGILYYPVIALPSILHVNDPSSNNHYHEKTANQLWYNFSGETYDTNPLYEK